MDDTVDRSAELSRLQGLAPWIWIGVAKDAIRNYAAEIACARSLVPTSRRNSKREWQEQGARLEAARQSVVAECDRALEHLKMMRPLMPDGPRLLLLGLLVTARARADRFHWRGDDIRSVRCSTITDPWGEELRDAFFELAEQIEHSALPAVALAAEQG